MSAPRLVVATVNTYLGRTIKTARGLAPLARADVILMQELFSPAGYGVETSLHSVGFELVAAEGHSGLGIAVRSDSAYRYAGGPVRSTVLEQAGRAERVLLSRLSREPLEYADLGVLAAQLDGPGGSRLVAATTHLPVVTAFRQRARFLSRLPLELADPYYDGPLVLTGDMNHWPGPRSADLAFRRRAGLAAVDLGREITWPSRRTRPCRTDAQPSRRRPARRHPVPAKRYELCRARGRGRRLRPPGHRGHIHDHPDA